MWQVGPIAPTSPRGVPSARVTARPAPPRQTPATSAPLFSGSGAVGRQGREVLAPCPVPGIAMQVEDVLAAYVEDYFETLSGISYTDLERRQHGFHSSLAFGAAGVAYACWHTALVLDEADLLDEAERWLGATRGREKDRLSFLVPLSKRQERPASHFLYGEAGLVFVRALVAHARPVRGVEPSVPSGLAAALQRCRRLPRGCRHSLRLHARRPVAGPQCRVGRGSCGAGGSGRRRNVPLARASGARPLARQRGHP